MRNTDKTQAQHEALAQLRAAFAACEAAGLRVVADSSGGSAYEVGVSDFDAIDGEPVVVLWLADDEWLELDGNDEPTVEDVEATCEKWLAQLGGDKDNAWPNVVAELRQDYECNDDQQTAIDLARNYFQAI